MLAFVVMSVSSPGSWWPNKPIVPTAPTSLATYLRLATLPAAADRPAVGPALVDGVIQPYEPGGRG